MAQKKAGKWRKLSPGGYFETEFNRRKKKADESRGYFTGRKKIPKPVDFFSNIL